MKERRRKMGPRGRGATFYTLHRSVLLPEPGAGEGHGVEAGANKTVTPFNDGTPFTLTPLDHR